LTALLKATTFETGTALATFFATSRIARPQKTLLQPLFKTNFFKTTSQHPGNPTKLWILFFKNWERLRIIKEEEKCQITFIKKKGKEKIMIEYKIMSKYKTIVAIYSNYEFFKAKT